MSRSPGDALAPDGPSFDPCSRCGRPVRRFLVLHVNEDLAPSEKPKVLCSSCLNRRRSGKKIWGALGGAWQFLVFLEGMYWIAIVFALILVGLIGLIIRK